MQLSADVIAAHAGLSGVARRFLDYVVESPACAQPLDYRGANYPDWIKARSGLYPVQVQALPTFVGEPKLGEIRHAVTGITRLIKSIPERIFERDPKRIADFYRLGHEGFATLLLEPAETVQAAVVRHDLVDGPAGFKCLEVNASNIGGWEVRFFERFCRDNPAIRPFLEQERLAPSFRDPFRELLLHVIEEGKRSGLCAAGELNIAIVLGGYSRSGGHSARDLGELYATLLREHGGGMTGEVVVCSLADGLSARQGNLYYQNTRIHAILEQTPTLTPGHVFRCWKGGAVSLYNGPLSQILGDKRNLALLSRCADSACFDEKERALIREHVPWTRVLVAGKTSFEEEANIDLPDLVVSQRERFVIKPWFGAQGKEVAVGRFMAPDDWRMLVGSAVATGKWIVQEYIESWPYVFQHGESGYSSHSVVWGVFCFGSTYGGGFLRMKPRAESDGIINSARGAAEGIFFEV